MNRWGVKRWGKPSWLPAMPSFPRSVWGCVVLMVVFLSASSVVTPLIHAPDEFAHYDLTTYLAAGRDYPQWDGRRFGTGVRYVAAVYTGDWRSPHKLAADAPRKNDRRNLADYGGIESTPEANYNQLAQHPPLYYEAMAVVLRGLRALTPGMPAVTTELAFLRLINALLIASLPLAAYLATRRLGGAQAAGVAAAALSLAVPQLTHIGASINNDNLLTLLSAWLAVLLIGVAKGDLRGRTALLVGVLEGLALLTKGFAFMYIPWIGLVYLVAFLRHRSQRRQALVGLGTAAISSAALSAWFWIGNVVRTGKVAPTTEDLHYSSARRPPGFEPRLGWFARRFGAWFPERFWGSMGGYAANLPRLLVGIATAVLVALIAVALVRPARGPGARRSTRVDLAVALSPVAILSGYIWLRAYGLYARSSLTPFIQGRYLFSVIVPIMGAAAIGLHRLVGRRVAQVALGVAVVMQAFGYRSMINVFWGAPSAPVTDKLRAMVAWSAYSGTWVAVGAVVGAIALVAGLGLFLSDDAVWPRRVDVAGVAGADRPMAHDPLGAARPVPPTPEV